MRILMIHPHDIYSDLEPWTRRVTSLAEELVRRGHEVKLVYHLLDPAMDPETAGSRQEFSFQTIPMIRYSFTLIKKARHMAKLARWANVVHVQKCFPHAFVPATYAALAAGRPLHYDWDDWEYGIYTWAPGNRIVAGSLAAFEALAPRLADTITVASQGLLEMCRERGFREDRIFPGPVGVDLEYFNPGAAGGDWVREYYNITTPIVMYSGQISGAQYLVDFLEAVREVLQSGVEARFMVVGGGDRLEETVALAETLGLGRHVLFTGPQPAEMVPRFLAAADVAVAAFRDNRQQACKSPLKVAEYMASGKAIVASDVGEARNFLGSAGLLCRPGDPADMARAIIRLLKDPELRESLGRRARSRAEERLSWGVTAENLLRAYNLGLELRGRGRIQPKPPELKKSLRRYPDHGSRIQSFIGRNLDLVGIINGEYAFRGPELLQIDLTTRCNNDCIGCWCRSPLLRDHRIDRSIRTQTLPRDLVFRLLEEVAGMGVKAIYYAGGGEPFMHPDIYPILKRTKELGLVCHINTNFTLVSDGLARKLVELPVDYLRISLWAATPETYVNTHPNKTRWSFKELERIISLMTRARNDFPKIEIYNVISRLNYNEVETMVQRALDLGVDGVEFALMDVIPGLTDSLLLTEKHRHRLLEQCRPIRERLDEQGRIGRLTVFRFDDFIRRIEDTGSLSGDYDREVIDAIPCTVGWTFSRILADGNVNGCLKAHRIPVGNIHEQNFSDIWNGPNQRNFRRETNVYQKRGNFFRMIGNDPEAEVGCHRGCDDYGRNVYTQSRLESLGRLKRLALKWTSRRLKP